MLQTNVRTNLLLPHDEFFVFFLSIGIFPAGWTPQIVDSGIREELRQIAFRRVARFKKTPDSEYLSYLPNSARIDQKWEPFLANWSKRNFSRVFYGALSFQTNDNPSISMKLSLETFIFVLHHEQMPLENCRDNYNNTHFLIGLLFPFNSKNLLFTTTKNRIQCDCKSLFSIKCGLFVAVVSSKV